MSWSAGQALTSNPARSPEALGVGSMSDGRYRALTLAIVLGGAAYAHWWARTECRVPRDPVRIEAPGVEAAEPTPPGEASPSEAASDFESLREAAWVRYRSGDLKRALEGFERLAERQAAVGDTAGELTARVEAAMVVSETGAPQRAIERHRRILERSEAAELHEVTAKSLLLLSRSLTLTGDFIAAHDALDRSLAAFEAAGSAEGPAKTGSGRAYTLVREGRMHEAIRVAKQAAAESERVGLTEDVLRSESALAYAVQQVGDETRAYELYHELLDKAWRNNNQRLIQFAYCNLAEIEWRRGNPRPAEDDLRATIDGLEATRADSPATGSERAAFLGLQVDAYDRLIRLLADTYRGVEGFAIAERFHALSLLEGLRGRQHAASEELSDDERRRLLADLGATRLAFDEAPTQTERAEHRAALQRLEALLAALSLERRPASSRDLPSLSEPPNDEQVRAALAPNEALVAYWVSEERILGWVLTPQRTRFVEMPIPRQRLADAIDRYLDLLRSPQRAEDAALKANEAEHIAAGRELYDWLVAPVRQAVAEAEVVVIVPDDLLHRLPFESLIESCEVPPSAASDARVHAAYRGCRFLGLSQAITYSPSAGVFLELRQRGRRAPEETSVLAMAPSFSAETLTNAAAAQIIRGALPRLPLVHAREEVRRVASLFLGGASRLGSQASEARFKAEASEHAYLHLATHGLVDDTLPMVSGLLLEPGDGEDGLLQAYEVLSLDLRSELVTLSACRSGRGELSRGEGVVGLARAFLQAGASSVLVSQWDVDDRSTPELMETFYRELTAGASRAEALRLARVELFEQTGGARIAFRQREVAYAHPRYWSSWVLIGVP
ncbi:MAG: CHAT domain-containing protein [Acidobacteriota bacterium]